MRILFNAEPFGFGPSAAIAAIAPHLIATGRHAYAGEGHSLDLQRHLPYAQVHDLTGRPSHDWNELISSFDLVVTAMDQRVAKQALSLGKPVVFYDALTWFRYSDSLWADVEKLIDHPDVLYVAQDFMGVRQRLAHLCDDRFCIIPPIIPKPDRPLAKHDSDLVVLNLGGLKNPFMSEGLLIDFARAMTSAVRAALTPDLQLRIATSRSIAQALNTPCAATFPVEEVAELMHACRFAICTPGLGNIYESAALRTPVIWLPPVNDTQGLQLARLRDAGLVDAEVNWQMLGMNVDYSLPLPACLDTIGNAIASLAKEPHRCALHDRMRTAATAVNGCREGKTFELVERFGCGGALIAATKISEWINASGIGEHP